MTCRDAGFEGKTNNKKKKLNKLNLLDEKVYRRTAITLLRPDGAAENLEILLCDAEMFMPFNFKTGKKNLFRLIPLVSGH